MLVECLAWWLEPTAPGRAVYVLLDACGSADNGQGSRPRLPVSGLGSGHQVPPPMRCFSNHEARRDLFLPGLRSLLTSSTAPLTPALANRHMQDLAPDGAHPPPETVQGSTAGPTTAQGKARRERLLLPLRRKRSLGRSRRYRRRPRPSPDALPANPLRSGHQARA